MIDFLVLLHASEELGFDVVVGPADVEVEVLDGVSLHHPFVLLSDVLHHSVLRLCFRAFLPLTLMIILCFLELNWLL